MASLWSYNRSISNILLEKQVMDLLINYGSILINKNADIHSFGTVKFHEDGISNIMALKDIIIKQKVIFYSEKKINS